MAQDTDVRLLITQHTEKGKLHLREASGSGSKDLFHNAIKEFILAYKNALFLNEDRATEHSCLFNIGSAYVAAGYYDRGIDVLKSVEQLIKQRNVASSSPSQADILFNIGFAYDQMTKDDVALSYYDKARHEYESQPSSPLLGETLLNMGKVYERKGDALQARACYSKATMLYSDLNKFEKACDLLLAQADLLISTSPVVTYECSEVLAQCQKQALRIGDDLEQANIFYKMALKYTLVSDFDNALHCFEQAEGLSKNKDRNLYANVCQNLGAIHNRLRDYLLAIQYHKKAVKIHGEQGNRNAQGQSFCNQAYAEIQLKYLDDAEMSYMHAKQAFRDCDNMYGRWHVYESLAGLSMVRGDFPRAIEHYKRAIKHQANAKDLTSDSQDRLIDKLVLAIDQYHRSKNSRNRPAIESVDDGPMAIESSKLRDPNIKTPQKQAQQPPEESITEVDALQDSSGSSTTKTYKAGRRDYRDDDQGWKPPQVARGLSSVTERSFSSSRSHRFNKKESGMSKVSWSLPTDSDSSLEDIFRPMSSGASRTGSRRRRNEPKSYATINPKLSPQLSFVEEESSPNQHDDSDTPRSRKSDTDYAGHYKKQIESIEEPDNTPRKSSSGFSSSDDSTVPEDIINANVGEVPKSMPRVAPPKPPRSNLGATYERPGSSESEREPGGAKKSLRFQDEQPLEGSTHLYASVKSRDSRETVSPGATSNVPKTPVPSSGDAVYDVPPAEADEDAEATPLYTTFNSQPTDESKQVVKENTVAEQVGRKPDDDLPSLPRRYQKNKQSKACIVM